MKLTPFEKNYGLKHVFYNKTIDLGLYIKLRPRSWFRVCWAHPEADVLWYDIGPLAFYASGA